MKHLKLSLCAAMLCLVGAGSNDAYAWRAMQYCNVDTTGTQTQSCTTPLYKLPANQEGAVYAQVYAWYSVRTSTATLTAKYYTDNGYTYWTRTIRATAGRSAETEYLMPAKSVVRNTWGKGTLEVKRDGGDTSKMGGLVEIGYRLIL
jgi:hypothetical protein